MDTSINPGRAASAGELHQFDPVEDLTYPRIGVEIGHRPAAAAAGA